MIVKRSNLRKNIRTGLGWGIGFAVVYTVIALLIWITGGSEPFAANETSLTTVLFSYWFGCVAGGAILGLLWPFRKYWAGAAIIGFLAVLPGVAFIALSLTPRSEWHSDGVRLALISAVALGMGGGIFFWYLDRRGL